MDLSPVATAPWPGLLWPCLAGIAAGCATGLVPGLHVNTIAAIALVSLPLDTTLSIALVCAATVHTFLTILPTTYLGVPDEDAGVSLLPAQRMLHAGDGSTAVRTSLHASLCGALLVVLAAPVYAWGLWHPVLMQALDAATPWVLLAVLVILLAGEWHRPGDERPLRRVAWGLATMALAGVVGSVALGLPMGGAWPGGSAFLPLLAGLFGMPALAMAWQHGKPPPPQRRARTRDVPVASAVLGVVAASWTAVLPGVTAATATAVARMGRRDDARRTLTTLSAVDTAHALFALVVLWTLSRARTGIAVAVSEGGGPIPWTRGMVPPDLALVLFCTLAAALAAVLCGHLLEPGYRAVAMRSRPRLLAATIASFVVALTAGLTGAPGLLVLGVATVAGLVPIQAGIRRIHLTAALILPALWRML